MIIESWLIPVKELITSAKVGEWCRVPYPGHPKGCPNFDKPNCPNQAPYVGDFFDLTAELYIVHSEFNLDEHAARMKEKHPQWSDRQCRCVLYWQPKSRKQLRERAAIATDLLLTDQITMIPEAMGVNVYATARKTGLILDRIKDLSICRHVALLGFKKC